MASGKAFGLIADFSGGRCYVHLGPRTCPALKLDRAFISFWPTYVGIESRHLRLGDATGAMPSDDQSLYPAARKLGGQFSIFFRRKILLLPATVVEVPFKGIGRV